MGWGGSNWSNWEHNTWTGSISNPAESANPGMLAVGAAHWDSGSIESYSSRGPTPDGRIKPDVVAAACGETHVYSQSLHPDFCGTSQAAPHVAGMAALVRERFSGYTPAQVVSYLKENAQQRISSPDPNNTWGHGFIALPPVADTHQPPATVPGMPTISSVTPGASSLSVAWSPPSLDGGAAISDYDLRHIRSDAANKADAYWTVAQDVWTESGALSYELTGLDRGRQYDVQVRAVNSAGDGPWSAAVAGTTTAAPPSNDATLSRLNVSPVDISGLTAAPPLTALASHTAWLKSTSCQRPPQGASIAINGAAVASDYSYPVALSEGRNTIAISVTAQDGRATKAYTLTIDRGSDAPFGWKVTSDISDLNLGNADYPRGLWSNGHAFYVACAYYLHNQNAELCAYNPDTGAKWTTYHTLKTHGNLAPRGIWSDGTTMWVVDSDDNRIYAYKTASYFRDTSKEIDLKSAFGASSGFAPMGIWSDGEIMWVATTGRGLFKKLYAYNLSTRRHEQLRDIKALEEAGNHTPRASGPTELQCGCLTTLTASCTPTIWLQDCGMRTRTLTH